jgi:hypothetical protein
VEAQLFHALYRHVTCVDHARRRRPRERFGDRAVVLVYLWSVLHERPVCWACRRQNWPPAGPPWGEALPSDSTMSRRLRTLGVQQLLERVLAAAADRFPPTLVKAVDSKPLYVGPYSKDADAKRGRVAAGQFARGYRLHALTHGRAVRGWRLGPMNEHDSAAAPALLLASLSGGGYGYVVADNAYDANELHALAARLGHQLVAPAQVAKRGVRDARHNCPQRLRSLDLTHCPLRRCAAPGEFGRALYDCREWAESCFGELTMMGLHYLPAWARGPRRVALWVAAKILCYLCRRTAKQGLMT